MPTGRWNLATTTLDGVIYAVGGFGPGPQGGVDVAATVEAYLPESDTWISLPSLPSPRAGAGGAAVGGRLYSVGGWGRREGWLGEGPMADVVAYSPAGGTWTQAPSPPMKGSTATGVVDGVIYAVVDGEQFYAFEP
jgi:N-acetylneuraminic acid mutarotase